MVVPSITEYIKGELQSWDEDIMAAEQVELIWQIKMSFIFQSVKNRVEHMGHCHVDISPKSFNSEKTKRDFLKISFNGKTSISD